MTRSLPIAFMAAICFQYAVAQDVDADSLPAFSINIDQVVVTGTRTPKLLKIGRAHV